MTVEPMSAPIARETIAAVVEAGMRGPSGDNCQPWRFRWDGAVLDVIFVPERAASFYDVRNVASWISLGAVIVNMSLAAARAGLSVAPDLFPRGGAPALVARARFSPGAPAPDPLVEAIAQRCVNRRPYRRDRVPAAIRAEMMALTAAVPGARLSWHESEPALSRVAALAAQNDRILFENRALHDGLYRWIRWTPADVARWRDGMPAETLELRPWERPGIKLLASWRLARLAIALGVGRGLPSRARGIYRRSGAIALLSMSGQAPEDFVRGGEALERIWLTATRHGLAFQPITGIIFLLLRLRLVKGEGLSPTHRRLLERLERPFRELFSEAANETPIMLFRLGIAPPPSGRAPRRAVEQVLTFDSPLT